MSHVWADASQTVVDVTGGAFVASAGNMAGMGGFSSSARGADGKIHRTYDKRAMAQGALKVMSSAAAGLATYGSGATCGGGAIAGAAIGLVATAVDGGFQAYDAQKTRAKLQKLVMQVEALSATRANKGIAADSAEAMDGWELYQCLCKCVGKSEHKLAYGAGNASIVGQPVVAGIRTGRAIAKFAMGTKGVGRMTRSETLYRLASDQNSVWCQIANDAIGAICAQSFEAFIKSSIADAMKS